LSPDTITKILAVEDSMTSNVTLEGNIAYSMIDITKVSGWDMVTGKVEFKTRNYVAEGQPISAQSFKAVSGYF